MDPVNLSTHAVEMTRDRPFLASTTLFRKSGSKGPWGRTARDVRGGKDSCIVLRVSKGKTPERQTYESYEDCQDVKEAAAFLMVDHLTATPVFTAYKVTL